MKGGSMATSNRVGHPVRNRKRNRLIFNEDEETSFGPHNRYTLYSGNNNLASKSQKNVLTTPVKPPPEEHVPVSKPGKFNKSIGTSLATSLKTLLKLPKANNWVNCEWFYGNIDQVLFLDENEFNICLRDSFPQLKTRSLARLEWSQIRRLMGKPRRCSASFFEEERSTLNNKRSKIRFLQQNKVTDLSNYKDLPDNIPQPLVVGTQVTALARTYDGLFFGVVEGIDSANGTYRISINRPDMGSLSVPDYEIASVNVPLMSPLSSFQHKERKIWHLTNRFVDCANIPESSHSSQQPPSERILPYRSEQNGEPNIGGFPAKFLFYLMKATKVLTVKKEKITELKTMNSEIERMTTLSETISYSFKKNYACTILELEKVNKELAFYMKKIQSYSLQVASEGKLKSLKPDTVGQKYLVEAKQLAEKLQPKFKVSEKTSNLICQLMSLMFHLRGFRDSEVSSYELQSLLKTMSKIRAMIQRNNVNSFQNNVEIHIRHIMSSVSHLGNVGAFTESSPSQMPLEIKVEP